MDYLIVLFWSLIGSAVSLVGGVFLLKNKRTRKLASSYGMPFGAGALLAAAFLGLLPEAIESSSAEQAVTLALVGFLAFFLLERSLGWFHHHEEHHHDFVHGKRNKTHTWLVVIGDTLHNFIDGLALGAAFLVSPAAGIGTAIAVAAHEVPQEIGDFGILLGKGMRPRRVLLVNFVSALATVVAALSIYALGSVIDFNPAPLLAVAAGFFIYIAASDIIPDIHEKPRREGNLQAAMLLLGVFVLAAVAALTPHDHEHTHDDDHSIDESVHQEEAGHHE